MQHGGSSCALRTSYSSSSLAAGLAIIAPNVPTLMTNFMASRRAHAPMVCEDYPPAHQPQACRNAYSDVVFWASASSFVSNSLLSFVMVSPKALEP